MTETCLLRLMEHALQEEQIKYEQMLELSEKQLSLLEENNPDTDAVAALMNQKMDLVGDIQKIEVQNSPVKEQWQQEHGRYSLDERSTVSTIRDESMRTIERLHKLEQDIASAIKKSETVISEKLLNLQRGRAANLAYFSYEQQPPRYIDKTK